MGAVLYDVIAAAHTARRLAGEQPVRTGADGRFSTLPVRWGPAGERPFGQQPLFRLQHSAYGDDDIVSTCRSPIAERTHSEGRPVMTRNAAVNAAITCTLMTALLFGPLVDTGHAQTSTDAPAAGPPDGIVADQAATYSTVAAPTLLSALDRAGQELDAFPGQPTPSEVKALTFRRRLLELRLLMDFGAFAYDPVLMGMFRDTIDDAYEQIGTYQDLSVVQDILKTSPPTTLVGQRAVRMTIALAPLRAPEVRAAMQDMFSGPSTEIRSLAAKDVPRLWSLAQTSPSQDLDAVGNVALLGASLLRGLQGPDIFVADIFDPQQETRFHDVRKALRSLLLLVQMFPDTRDATQAVREPLADLVSQYGDVNDAIVAYRTAQAFGGNVDLAVEDLRKEFAKAQARQELVVSERSFDAMIASLTTVQETHRR
jgi:hypothetical protein